MDKVVCIITHHKGDLIRRCLDSLIGENIRVITSDFTFKDPGHKAKIVSWVSRNEPAYKRNKATEFYDGKYIAFLDDDVEVDKNCIKNMADYLDNHPDVGMVYALLYNMQDRKIVDTSGSWLSWTGFLIEKYDVPAVPREILSAKSACCMVRTDLFNQAGKFDEDFVIYGEETDLSWRIWNAGYSVVLLPSAIGYHAFGTAIKDESYYNKRYIHYNGCKNYLTMLIKNLPTSYFWIVFVNGFIWFTVSLCFLFTNRQVSKWILEGIWYNIKNWKYIYNKRENLNRNVNMRRIMITVGARYYFSRFWDYLIHQLHRKTK